MKLTLRSNIGETLLVKLHMILVTYLCVYYAVYFSPVYDVIIVHSANLSLFFFFSFLLSLSFSVQSTCYWHLPNRVSCVSSNPHPHFNARNQRGTLKHVYLENSISKVCCSLQQRHSQCRSDLSSSPLPLSQCLFLFP